MSQPRGKIAARRTMALLLAAALACEASVAGAQIEPTRDAGVPPEQAERLDRFRRIIENVNDSDSTRTAQAEELLLTGEPAAADLVVTLLTTSEEPSTKIVLCQAVRNIGQRHPRRLDSRLIDPLLALLASPSEAVARRAGEALAAFRDARVFASLSAVAANPEAPLEQRLAALDALAPNTDRRKVVDELVKLLDTQEPELITRIVSTLKQVSGADYGNDVPAWRHWWKTQSSLSETQWLGNQLAYYARRLQQTEQGFSAFKAEADERHDHLAARLAQSLSALYRLTPAPEKDTLLESWLADTTTECRRVAVSLVAEQISEGNLPSDDLRAALRRRYNDDSFEVRKLAVEIVGALNDPADAGPMLTRLGVEKDEGTREMLLRVLGKLRNPAAIQPLLAELSRLDAPDRCVAAAADALGMLAARGRVEQQVLESLVAPLKTRFARSGGDAGGGPRDGEKAPEQRGRAVKVAILGAMAAIGAPEFKPEFEANLSADDPELLLRAIQGVATIGNGAQVDRLSNLTTHTDARVRQRAIAALGTLGTEEQLSTIIARLSPSVETVEGPRRAAWQAFKQICARLPLGDQVAAGDRLVDQPNLAAEYLKEVHEQLMQTNPPPAELSVVREKLAQLYTSLGRNSEALPYWRQLYAAAVQTGAERAHEFGLALLRSSLACDKTDQLGAIMRSLATAGNKARQAATSTVTAYLDTLRAGGRDGEARALAAELADLPAETFPALRSYLDDHFAPAEPGTTPQPSAPQ